MVKLRTKKCVRKVGCPRIDTSMTCNQDKVEEFACALKDSLSGPPSLHASKRWEPFRDAVYKAAMSMFARRLASRQTGSRLTWQNRYPSSWRREKLWLHTKSVPVNGTCRSFGTPAAKFSRAPGTVLAPPAMLSDTDRY